MKDVVIRWKEIHEQILYEVTGHKAAEITTMILAIENNVDLKINFGK